MQFQRFYQVQKLQNCNRNPTNNMPKLREIYTTTNQNDANTNAPRAPQEVPQGTAGKHRKECPGHAPGLPPELPGAPMEYSWRYPRGYPGGNAGVPRRQPDAPERKWGNKSLKRTSFKIKHSRRKDIPRNLRLKSTLQVSSALLPSTLTTNGTI